MWEKFATTAGDGNNRQAPVALTQNNGKRTWFQDSVRSGDGNADLVLRRQARFWVGSCLCVPSAPLAGGPEVAKGRTREDARIVQPDASTAQI
jgi:hypothetical protein